MLEHNTTMNFPELTPHQETILGIIGALPTKGRHLRGELARQGINKSGPAFYQMMSRLEDSGLVEGWYEQKIIGSQIIKERTYKMTGKGRHALMATLDYYRQRSTLIPGLGGGLANA